MSKILSKNKRVLFLALGIALLVSLLPLHCAEASIISKLKAILSYLISLPLRVVIFMNLLPIFFTVYAVGIVYIVVAAMTEILLSASISVGVSPYGLLDTVPAVAVGWEFTRGLVNMFFILILVFIGLATILRIKDYEAKKLLPKLIIIAILVNFTPVIVGFIVDIANLVTNFFLGNIEGISSTAKKVATSISDEIGETLIKVWTDKASISDLIKVLVPKFAGYITYGVIGVIFLIYASYVYCLVALIFLLRIVWLWILMILAPIAFFSYILPPTGKVKYLFPDILHWDKWWEELIKWSIVGIPFAFFIYLSTHLIASSNVDTIFTTPTDFTTDFEDDFKYILELLKGLLNPVLGLAVLNIGYRISKNAAPAAAQGLIKGVESVGKMAAMAATTVATAGAAGFGAKILSRVPIKGVRRLTVAPLLKYQARAQKRMMGVSDDFKEMTPENKALYTKTLGKRGRLAHAAYMAKKGDLAKTDEKFRSSVAENADLMVGEDYAKKYVGEIADAMPDKMTEKIIIGLEPKDKKDKLKKDIENKTEEMSEMLDEEGINAEIEIKYKINQEDITDDIRKQFREKDLKDIAAASIYIGKLKPADVAKMSGSSLKSLAVRRGSRNWTPGHLAKARDSFDKETIDDFFKGAGGINSIGLDELYKINPRLVRYFAKSPIGQQWVYKRGKKINLEKLEAEIRRMEEEAPTPPPIPAWTLIREEEIKKEAEKLWKAREDVGDLRHMPKKDWAEASKELIKKRRDLIKTPTPLPEIKRKRGMIPTGIREEWKEGKKLISHINKQIKKFKGLGKERIKLEKQLETLSKEESKAVLPVEKGVIRQRIEKRKDRIEKIIKRDSKEIQEDIEAKRKTLSDQRKAVEDWKKKKEEEPEEKE